MTRMSQSWVMVTAFKLILLNEKIWISIATLVHEFFTLEDYTEMGLSHSNRVSSGPDFANLSADLCLSTMFNFTNAIRSPIFSLKTLCSIAKLYP